MRRTGLRERRAQIILLVRAFEESDPEGLVLPLRERSKATRRALMVTGLSGESAENPATWRIRYGEAVMRRSRLLFDQLMRRQPALGRILTLSQLGASTGPALVVVAFVLGLLTNALGPERRINLLAFPLIGLVAWNFVAYAVFAVRAGIGRGRQVTALVERVSGYLFRSAVGRRLRNSKIVVSRRSPESSILTKAVMRFGAMWHRLAGPLLAARVRRILDVAALATIGGVVTGMYLRGVAFEYRVTWESTWLDAPQMQWLMEILLGPASAVLGIGVPDVAPLRGPDGSGDAAPWIHLWAMTALLFVGLPRTLMGLYETWLVRRLSRRMPLDLDDAYYGRLFTAWRGATRQVEIVPYSYTPKSGALASLKMLLFDFFGARADLHVAAALSYGDEASDVIREPEQPDDAADGFSRERCLVVLFNVAQSPENDVHGEFLEQLTARLDPGRSQLLVVLDSSAYRERIGDRDRVAERLEAWVKIVSAAGLTAFPIDLERSGSPAGSVGEQTKGGATDDAMRAMRSALWPDRESIETAG